MNKPWSHLPNAQHIDDVIGLVKQHPTEFSAAYVAVWNAERVAARDAAWLAARSAAWDAERVAAWDAARDAARSAAYGAVRDAVLAFVAYDDCTKYLHMSYDQLKVWVELSENPAAVLLLPYVKARELIKASVDN